MSQEKQANYISANGSETKKVLYTAAQFAARYQEALRKPLPHWHHSLFIIIAGGFITGIISLDRCRGQVFICGYEPMVESLPAAEKRAGKIDGEFNFYKKNGQIIYCKFDNS